MPGTNYVVAVSLNGQGAVGWGPGPGGSSVQCNVFDAAIIDATQFSITWRRCDTGAPVPVVGLTKLGWIAIATN
ncbi:MAG: hypothetical protein R6W48_04060 [Gaiellaceae bacterium]